MSNQAPRFGLTKYREGYDVGEVDAFILRIEEARQHIPPTLSADDVRAVMFPPSRLRTGYDQGQVDDWLDEVAADLDRLHSHASGHAARDPQPAEYDVPPELRGVSAEPSAIREVAGTPLWVRLTALVLVVAVASFFVLSYFI